MDRNIKYKGLSINGEWRNTPELISYCKACLDKNNNSYCNEEWKRNVFLFILEWLNKKDYFTANTSGSTGKPKTIKLKKHHAVNSAKKTITFLNLKPENNALLCLSPKYIAGKMMIIRAFTGQLNLIITNPSSNPIENINTHIHFTAMVPLQVNNSIPYFKDNFDKIIVGGGIISNNIREKIYSLKNNFYETYGMTETVSHIAIREIKNNSEWFKALPNIKLSTDNRNCLVIDAKDISKDTIITNDIVEIKNNNFKFIGRFDNIINSGGIKIIPETIEGKLKNIINQDFIVSAIPDNTLGEKLVLVLKTNPENNIIEKIKSSKILTRYHIPREVIVINHFPITSTGKIKRNEIRKLINDKI